MSITFPLLDAPFLWPTCLLCGTRDADGTWLVVVERVETRSPGRFSVPWRTLEPRHFCPACAARYPDPLSELKRQAGGRR